MILALTLLNTKIDKMEHLNPHSYAWDIAYTNYNATLHNYAERDYEC